MTAMERLFMIFLVMILLVTVSTVVDTVYHHFQQEHRKDYSSWVPSDAHNIPVCDAVLWDRIKDRCGEQR